MAPRGWVINSALLGLAKAVSISVSSTGGNATYGFQYGIMFEDINHSGDGGIYAELIQNRAFQESTTYPATLDPWKAVGDASLSLDTESPLSQYLQNSVKVTASSAGTVGLSNPGWWGIKVAADEALSGSFYTKGAYSGNFTAMIKSDLTDDVWASAEIVSDSTADAWTQHKFVLEPTTDGGVNNSLVLQFTAGEGDELNFNLISLFPPTFNNRENGNRIELMQVLKDLKPSFFRIPGGNNLEGQNPPYFWNWSATIGDLTERPGRPGTWTYQNTDGIGLIEYLNWCIDLEAEPLLGLWGGFYLNGEAVPVDELDYYVQDVLNELEFAMGDADTEYGAKRIALGYEEPYSIKFVEVGNEDNLQGGAESYSSYRFQMFFNAITEKFPDITVFSSTVNWSPKPNGSAQDYHEYTRPDTFVSQFHMFDNYTADHLTVIGEYATVQNYSATTTDVDWSLPKNPYPWWLGTVAEAVFLLGFERNSDRVMGAAYAPLLQNLNSYVWSPDLISFTADPAQTVLSTSYHLFKLFSSTRFTATLPATSEDDFGPAYWATGINEDTNTYVFKCAVYNTTETVPFAVSFEGVEEGATGMLTVLSSSGPWAANVLGGENVVVETSTEITAGEGGVFEWEMDSLTVGLFTVGRS